MYLTLLIEQREEHRAAKQYLNNVKHICILLWDFALCGVILVK